MKHILSYLNPIDQLGKKHYSTLFPLGVMVSMYIIFEIAYALVPNPQSVGVYLIFVSIALILYLSFRDGLKGGFIASIGTVLYYFYIIYAHHYSSQEQSAGIDTTIVLGVLYLLIAGIIGWLKLTIDRLIEREADEKKRLVTIIEQLPVGVLITDNNGALVESNRQLEKILGLKMPRGFIVGKDTLLETKINGEAIIPSKFPLANALSKGKQVVTKELSYERGDGKIMFLNINSAPIHNRKGRVIAAASIISDITHSKEMEKRKDDFINMASHELKTPITSMKLYIDILLGQIDKEKNAKTLKIAESIKYQTERLSELVSDLLDVSRLQTGKLAFSKEEFRLDELITQTVGELQGITKEHKLVIKAMTPIKVLADRFRIYQVFANLITNAIKYSENGTVIEVSVVRADGKAVVSVTDHGMGIIKDEQAKIFERLYQITDERGIHSSGLGMGLYISQQIVKRHNGRIWVESVLGKGSTFSFSLPSKTKRK
ncbi:hypothetical protein BH09PAT1_BH09PAT1_0130 [soil metagenome]